MISGVSVSIIVDSTKEEKMEAKHWRVQVDVDGENVLSIETNCYGGVNNISEYGDVIRECASHLLAFIGDSGKHICPECKGEKYVRVGIDEYEPCPFCIC